MDEQTIKDIAEKILPYLDEGQAEDTFKVRWGIEQTTRSRKNCEEVLREFFPPVKEEPLDAIAKALLIKVARHIGDAINGPLDHQAYSYHHGLAVADIVSALQLAVHEHFPPIKDDKGLKGGSENMLILTGEVQVKILREISEIPGLPAELPVGVLLDLVRAIGEAVLSALRLAVRQQTEKYRKLVEAGWNLRRWIDNYSVFQTKGWQKKLGILMTNLESALADVDKPAEDGQKKSRHEGINNEPN